MTQKVAQRSQQEVSIESELRCQRHFSKAYKLMERGRLPRAPSLDASIFRAKRSHHSRHSLKHTHQLFNEPAQASGILSCEVHGFQRNLTVPPFVCELRATIQPSVCALCARCGP